MLERLNQVNDVIIRAVEDPEFGAYGRIVTGYDFSPLLSYLEGKTEIPEAGIELIRYEKNGCNVNMEVSAQAGAYVDADLLLFTGYKAFDDSGNELPCTFGENNRLRIQFPAAYEGKVLVRYTGRLRWRVTDGVSFFLLLFLLASRICRKKQDSGSRSGRSVHSVRI